MMMSALKITADRIALWGVARCMMLSFSSAGYVVANAAGMIAKYLATSFAMLNVVKAPRVISICLPVSTTSRSFVGFESRSTMLPASLAACVPEFMATATSACASAGASLVPSPVIATSRPCPCMSRISFSFVSGVASARKSSIPALAAMAAAFLDVPLADAVLVLGEDDDAATLGRLVGERRQLRGVGEVPVSHARCGVELSRLAVAECDGARLVEQEHVHVAGGLHGPARHGDHVLLDHPVHAGDANRGQERTDRGGDQAYEQGHQHGHGHR